MHRPADITVAAAGNTGILDAQKLAALGVSRATADRRVRGGEWQRLASGLYLPGAQPPNRVQLAKAAQRYGGPYAVISGLLAAAALGLRWVPEPRQAMVLVGAERRLSSTQHIDVRRCAALADVATWRASDVTYAMGDRAVLDGALQLSTLRSVRGLVLGAVADRWTDVASQQQILSAEPRNGTALLRRALRDAERGCASPPEAELVDALLGCRLPFLVNPELYVDDVLVGSPNVWFVGLGCGSEMDSRERHEEDDDFDNTLGRHDRFGGHGLVLSHLTPRRFRRDPAAGIAAVLDVVRARQRLPTFFREPAGLRLVPHGPLLR